MAVASMTKKMPLVSVAMIHLVVPVAVNLVEGLFTMVGDSVKATVSPGLEWVSNCLKHGLRWQGYHWVWVGTTTGRRMRTGTMSLFS
jgi:hypothetical protein